MKHVAWLQHLDDGAFRGCRVGTLENGVMMVRVESRAERIDALHAMPGKRRQQVGFGGLHALQERLDRLVVPKPPAARSRSRDADCRACRAGLPSAARRQTSPPPRVGAASAGGCSAARPGRAAACPSYRRVRPGEPPVNSGPPGFGGRHLGVGSDAAGFGPGFLSVARVSHGVDRPCRRLPRNRRRRHPHRRRPPTLRRNRRSRRRKPHAPWRRNSPRRSARPLSSPRSRPPSLRPLPT